MFTKADWRRDYAPAPLTRRAISTTDKPRQIVIIQGHPDSEQTHLCHALAEAYAAGAYKAGHQIATINIAGIVPSHNGKMNTRCAA